MSPRRITPAQLKTAMQKAQRDAQRAIDTYNREARAYNAKVKRAVDEYNREVRNYNAKARAHNRLVDNQRQRLNQELRRLQSRPASTTFTTYRATTATFVEAYGRAETRLSGHGGLAREVLDRTSDDAANSVYLLNTFDGDGETNDDPSQEELSSPSLTAELSRFGTDLVDRWVGALYALSPQNPDAARHFCASAREVIISILDSLAPDADVLRKMPDCDMHDDKSPTRRSKVRYMLLNRGLDFEELADAVSEDVDNVLSLFRLFNDGTHGHAGRFTITELSAVRLRVESAVSFLADLAA